jgi:hypothetical protein
MPHSRVTPAQRDRLQAIVSKAFSASIGEVKLKKDEWVDFDLSEKELFHLMEKTGIDFTGYKRTISIYDCVHTFLKHGHFLKEARRGQLQINGGDLELLPFYLKDSEIVDMEYRNGLLHIKSIFVTLEAKTFIVEAVRTKRKKLAFKTMYRVK